MNRCMSTTVHRERVGDGDWGLGWVGLTRGEPMYEHNGPSCPSWEVAIGGVTRGEPLYGRNGSSCASWEVMCEGDTDTRGFELCCVGDNGSSLS